MAPTTRAALALLLSFGCGAPRSAEEATAAAGLLGPLVEKATNGARPACRVSDRRVGQPASRRTRYCSYPAIPRLQLWLPPEGMAQPILSYRSEKLSDSSSAIATRDSILRQLRSDGPALALRECAAVPQRRLIRSVTRAETLGADITFLIIGEPDGSYSLHVRASPAGSGPLRERCDSSTRPTRDPRPRGAR